MSENPQSSGNENWQDEVRRAQVNREQEGSVLPPITKRKNIFKILLKGILAGIVTLSLFFGWVYADHVLLPFNAQAWRANVGRDKQAGRLIRQINLTGMTQSSVRKLLGKPDKTRKNAWIYIFKVDDRKPNYWEYSIVVVFQNGQVLSFYQRAEQIPIVY